MYILTTLEFPTHNINFHLVIDLCIKDNEIFYIL